MTLTANSIYLLMGLGAFIVVLLIASAWGGAASEIDRRLARVGQKDGGRKIHLDDRAAPPSVKSIKDSSIPLLDKLVKSLPNPDKLRARLARTGYSLTLGEYLLMNLLTVAIFYFAFKVVGGSEAIAVSAALMAGLGIPHAVTALMGAARIRKFIASFPEAIDTMCRGIRSGLPITESIAAVGREMPDPVGIEFRRIADGVRLGKSLEASMWDVAPRIDAAEFRFLIVAMAIQKETGGNLAETLSNLSDLIRKRRQLKLKIKAMSSEAKASAMIIGSLPFIMFGLLLLVNADYVMVLFHRTGGKILVGAGLAWMAVGWGVMLKMIHFEI